MFASLQKKNTKFAKIQISSYLFLDPWRGLSCPVRFCGVGGMGVVVEVVLLVGQTSAGDFSAARAAPISPSTASKKSEGHFLVARRRMLHTFGGWSCNASERAWANAGSLAANARDNETTRKTRSFSAAASYPLARTVCTGVCSTRRRPRRAGGRLGRELSLHYSHSHGQTRLVGPCRWRGLSRPGCAHSRETLLRQVTNKGCKVYGVCDLFQKEILF